MSPFWKANGCTPAESDEDEDEEGEGVGEVEVEGEFEHPPTHAMKHIELNPTARGLSQFVIRAPNCALDRAR